MRQFFQARHTSDLIVYVPMKDCVPKYNNLNIFAIYTYLCSSLMDIFHTPIRQFAVQVSLCILAASVTQAEDIFPYMIHQFPCCLPCMSPCIRATSDAQAVDTLCMYMLHPFPCRSLLLFSCGQHSYCLNNRPPSTPIARHRHVNTTIVQCILVIPRFVHRSPKNVVVYIN